VDIDANAIAHAQGAYGNRPGLGFQAGSATALPLPDASVDLVVSFETIEHLPAEAQPLMIAEFARVLAPDGLLLLSAPNRIEYSDARDYRNPFHLHEHDRRELGMLLGEHFPAQQWFAQRRYFGSAIWSEGDAEGFEALAGDASEVAAAVPPPPLYFLVLASRHARSLKVRTPALSLFSDKGEGELARLDAQAAEVMRLDALLGERDRELAGHAGHLRHLEELIAHAHRVVEERDLQLTAANQAHADAVAELSSRDQALGALTGEVTRLERALTAQERIIAYRQSARWWLKLPWMRWKLWWLRMRGE
jgi:SAM-dependent methyltransferase